MKEKRVLLFIVVVLVMILTGCSTASENSGAAIKMVGVMEASAEKLPLNFEYIGTVEAKELSKYSFKISGKIASVYVKEGQKVKKNDPLVRLDTTDVDIAVVAAQNTMEQAQKAFEFSEDYSEKIQLLYEAGAVSKQEWDKAKLDLDMLETSFLNAQLDYENKRNVKQDATIIAAMEGVIAEIPYQEGEIVAAGYPVVLLRSKQLIVVTGVTERDIGKVKIGNKAQIEINNIETFGTVTNVAQIPDKQTRTYKVEITIEQREQGIYNDVSIGMMAAVSVKAGEISGVFIPIDCIQQSDVNYVYVIENEIAVKRNLILFEIYGDKVRVEGLNDNEKVVIEGMKRLKDGDRVSCQS